MNNTNKNYCISLEDMDFIGIKEGKVYEYSYEYNAEDLDTYYTVYTNQHYDWVGSEDMFNKSFFTKDGF